MKAPPVAGVSAREYLFGLTLHGIKLGLDNIRYLLAAAGDPQTAHPTVHVAGTNGKGSTLALLAAILAAAGYHAGRFTSPHLIDVNERFLLGGCPVDDATLDAHIAFFRGVAATMDHPPTFFEMNTAIAFRLFQERAVDLGLIEVGMGGRYDSTNVLSPEATAITSIGLDHTEYLGDTLEAIAAEKAGIIKPGVPVVLGDMAAGPRAVIEAAAAQAGAPLRQWGRDFTARVDGPRWQPRFHYQSETLVLDAVPLALSGPHQVVNAATAVMLAETLREKFPKIDAETIAQGLANARWPCRLERVLDDPPVYIDAAHNPAGAAQIAAMPGRWTVLAAMSADKDAAGLIAALAPVADNFIFSAYGERRAMPAETLAAAAGSVPCRVIPALAEALEAGMALATAAAPLLITGSIYTAGEARQLLTTKYGAPPLRF